MFRLFICVSVLIVQSEQRYSSEENLSVSKNDYDNVHLPNQEQRPLVRPFEIDFRDKFSNAITIGNNKQILQKYKKRIEKQEESKQTKAKNNPKKSKKKPKNIKNDRKTTKEVPKKPKQGFKIIIDNNVINIQTGQDIQVGQVAAEYDDEEEEVQEDTKKDKSGCAICGWLPGAKWPKFNPPFWPFKI